MRSLGDRLQGMLLALGVRAVTSGTVVLDRFRLPLASGSRT